MENDDKLIKIIKNNEYINIMYDKSDANVEKKDYEIAIELYKSFKLLFPTEMRYIEDAGLTDSFFIFLKNHAFQFQYQNSSIFRMHLNDFFTMHNKLKNAKQLLAYSPSLFPLDKAQQIVLDTFGLDNLKKFELETGIFSHNFDMFEALSFYLIAFLRSKNEIVYNNELSYDEFTSLFAVYLNNMRKFEVFHRYPDYGWMDGEFREKHPEIFIDNNAPEELKKAFYKGEITLGVLQGHEEYIPFLLEKDLSVINDLEITIVVGHTTDESNYLVPIKNNFIEEYTNRYGKEKMLKLLVKYGPIINDLELSAPYNEIDDPEKIEQVILDEMYYWIVNSRVNYYYLIDVPEFREKYPDLFIDFDKITTISYEEKARLTKSFYDRELKFEDIRKYPELIDILVDKNLFVAFGENLQVGKKLLELIGKRNFLELCSIYGTFCTKAFSSIEKKEKIYASNGDMDLIHQMIKSYIAYNCINGYFEYSPETAPDFLKNEHPELFLSDDAPDELKDYYYAVKRMSFRVLKSHYNEWMPYLKGKRISQSIIYCSERKTKMEEYFNTFGEDDGIKLGISKPETVNEMIKNNKSALMKKWYDKTGKKFVPDLVIMQNFRIEEADKFLTSTSNWSALMKIEEYAESYEARDAVLKLAYSFGVFDQDQKGLKKLLALLTEPPKRIASDFDYYINGHDKAIDENCEREKFFNEKDAYDKMIKYVQEQRLYETNTLTFNDIVYFLQSLNKENINIDLSQPIFSQIYRKIEDGSYVLTINSQNCPETSKAIMQILRRCVLLPILTSVKVHKLFGGFKLQYDPEFREFLLANIDTILTTSEYTNYLASIQRQFKDIKAMNSNRVLTLDLAVSYVQQNKYASIEVGNERMAEISSIAGYDQEDFEVLQQIYNYGKQRVFSSIPRVENEREMKSGKYTYEILRLDDPLAMAIGTLTDCCQELGDAAEVCMEHSMVDKNGRVFVIKDSESNIVAQSWVWRNKDVLCFDNIEIPDKAFKRFTKGHQELDRSDFTDDIYELYKQAAEELIMEDEKIYKILLDSEKITEEQYNSLRLGKITVGLGYNDIAESIKKKAKLDKGTLTAPLPFEPPVELSRGLYTSDSRTQYILKERDDRREYDGDALPVHSDTYKELSNSNFNEVLLHSLQRLEIATKDRSYDLDTEIDEEVDKEHIVTELADNYDLNPETTRIIMNPNFAIIYDINGNTVRIADLLFNVVIGDGCEQKDISDIVLLQIRLALEQIAGDKEIDVSRLSEEQLEMYQKAISLTNEMDIERGVSGGR